MMMKPSIQSVKDKLAALNTRERWMVFFAGLAVVYGVINALLLSPVLDKEAEIKAHITQAQTQLADIQQQVSTLAQTPANATDAARLASIKQLNTQIKAQAESLQEIEKGMVSPAEMPALLKQLMQRHAEIRLVDMKTNPPENFVQRTPLGQVAVETPAPKAANATNISAIYKHSISLTLSGNYMDLLHYAEALQTYAGQVWWEKASLSTQTYPNSELTIVLYTLSLDKTWLSI
jgi:MSHA biogenesis protein MshJ